ncbi:hypothetical protein CQU01_02740 [Cerasibacillus quisquiliarum]|uniref:Uncharacterized protein n=1 Tax=Cerasibacillus quisquiliarum TaxID=227865 RepID=A0A511UTW0_9BACI|nr:hypothetical protein CQU01_02740 [Cerasibacillus quisquiliarum]
MDSHRCIDVDDDWRIRKNIIILSTSITEVAKQKKETVKNENGCI